MPTLNLTKTAVEGLPFAENGVALYYDEKLRGFGVRVSKTSKSYFAENRVNGKTRRVKIGAHGSEITTEAARKKAQSYLSQMNEGIDLNAGKRKIISRNSITLEKVFADYIDTRKDLKPKTHYDYKNVMRLCFDDWARKSLVDINQSMVVARHKKIGETQGKAYANLSMRVLRAIFNFAIAHYDDAIQSNPVKGLSETRAWYKVDRRRTFIKAHEFPAVFDALDKLEETKVTTKAEAIRDYVLLLLMTGLRRQEGAKLQWRDIDFTAKTLTITDTKNGEVHTLPLTDFMFDMLNRRYENRIMENPYVFPGNGEKNRFLVEPRKQMMKVWQLSGVNFTVHDLRRTFATIAENLVSAYQLKRLLNHKSSDVTAGYVISDVETLRSAMQRITDKILTEAGRDKSAEVIQLVRKAV